MRQSAMSGILFMFAASLTFSLMNACVKLLDSMSSMELIFFRHVFTAICIGIWWCFTHLIKQILNHAKKVAILDYLRVLLQVD